MTPIKIVDSGEAGPPDLVPGGEEWRNGPYIVSTNPARLDFATISAFLAESYWAREISEATVRRSVDHSIAFGLYEGDRQVGFARVTTDRTTFAWVGDVFVLEDFRGRGLSIWLMRCVLAHPDLQGLRRWMLASTSARGIYERLGFTPLGAPDRFMEIADPGVHARQRAKSGGR
jgi:GNAT superfamily N-acetyltransferase